jgi:type IV pilus assembly protein PilC
VSGINLKNVSQGRAKSVGDNSQWNLEKILQTDINLFPVRFADKQKEAFYLELSTLLEAGLNIKSALDLIEAEQVKDGLKKILAALKENLVNGDSLWEAMKKSTQFTPYEYYSIQIGEETGQLYVVLNQLHLYFNSRLKQRRQFIGALSYPLVILITSIGAVSFMLLFIVPMFAEVFKRFGGELPYLTRIIISASSAIQSNFYWFLLAIIIPGIYLYINRNAIWLKQTSTRILKHVPVVGKIIYSIQLARFCTSMALLLGAKVPMIRSINLINKMVTFYPIQITLEPIAAGIISGETLHASMAKYPVYSKRMISLIKVGEEVNRLETFFEKLARQYGNDVEHHTNLLNTFLEPVMIIFLGIVIGFILLAMYLPMFEMSTSIGG